MIEFSLFSLEDTQKAAIELAKSAKLNDIFLLYGDLGTGKTTFSRFFIREFLNAPNLNVTSPTFTLIQTYGEPPEEIWHIDLYRIQDPSEIYNLGLEDIYGNALMLIEWPERFGNQIPSGNITRLDFSISEKARRLNVKCKLLI
jgi:tRNA threonylcarbamoyl adenosine modification protein YjeE